MINSQILDSLSPQQGASKPIRRLTGYMCTSPFGRESKQVFRVCSICVRLYEQVNKYEHRLLSIMQIAFYAMLHLVLWIFHFNGYALPTIKPNLRDRPL